MAVVVERGGRGCYAFCCSVFSLPTDCTFFWAPVVFFSEFLINLCWILLHYNFAWNYHWTWITQSCTKSFNWKHCCAVQPQPVLLNNVTTWSSTHSHNWCDQFDRNNAQWYCLIFNCYIAVFHFCIVALVPLLLELVLSVMWSNSSVPITSDLKY
jgi:hypothetical protein